MEMFAVEVVRKLRERNFCAFFAGGCVRDRLLGRSPKDFDVATDARPEEVREVFGRRRTLAIGASFGVITVLGPKPLQVEVATFRSDGQYTDGRRPDDVVFSTAEADAQRRDFTINGMFFDPLEGQLIDYVGGEADLQSRIVRAIGDPLERITEDRLRMLRAIRFAATYGCHIDPATMAAVQSQASFLLAVSQERITAELLRMLTHPSRSQALALMKDSELLPFVLSPFERKMSASKWSRLLSILASECIDSEIVALAAIVGKDGLDLSIADMEGLSRALRLSNEDRNTLLWIAANRHQLESANTASRSALQPLLVQPQAKLAVALLESVAEVDDSPRVAIDRCRDFLQQPLAIRDPAPLLRGGDLKKLGMQPGPRFSKILAAVRAAQLDGLISDPEEAIAFAQDQEAKLRD